MTQLKTIGKYKDFNSIPVGEVFAFKGCWVIMFKDTEKTAIALTHNYHPRIKDGEYNSFFDGALGKSLPYNPNGFFYNEFIPTKSDKYGIRSRESEPFYKLPEALQKLWRTE